jgi:hypothetical protein
MMNGFSEYFPSWDRAGGGDASPHPDAYELQVCSAGGGREPGCATNSDFVQGVAHGLP